MFFKYHKKLPKGQEGILSPYLKEKAEGYVSFPLNGRQYFVPVTKKLRKLGELPKPKKGSDRWDIPYDMECALEGFLQTVADSIYLQMRETIGAEVYQDIHEELQETFEQMFTDKLSKRIDDKMEKAAPIKLLVDKTEEDKKC
jgi:hypothetical protein